MGGGPHLLGHEAYILVGLIVAGGYACIPHQRTYICDSAAGLRVLLEPAHDLADEVAPADSEPLCAELLQKLQRPLGEHEVYVVIVAAVLNEHTALNGAYAPQPVHQPCCFRLRVVDGYLNYAQLSRLRQQAADHGAGDSKFPGYVALFVILR